MKFATFWVVLVFAVPAVCFGFDVLNETQKLLASDAAEYDYFGISVAIDGDTAIVGAEGDVDNGYSSGSAYLFDVATGAQIAKLTASDAAEYDYFGASMAIDGDTAIVGAYGDDDNGSYSGSAYVFELVSNTTPIADAGTDQTVYLCGGDAGAAVLDGSGSSDGDGDALTYRWYEGGELIGEGMSPSVEFLVGEHVIELIVNDGTEDSLGDSCLVTVVGGIEVGLNVLPRVINRKSHGPYLPVMMRVGDGVDVNDIEGRLWIEPSGAMSIRQWVTEDGHVMAVFAKDEVLSAVAGNGAVDFKVSGRLSSGECVYGVDMAVVIEPGKNR